MEGVPTALTQGTQSSQSGAEASGYVEREANSKTTLRSSAVYAFSASAPAGMPTARGTEKPTALTQRTQGSQSGTEASGYVEREANSKATLRSSAVYVFSASAPAGMPTARGTEEPTALTQRAQSSQSGAESSGDVGREANSKATLRSSAVYAFSASAPAGMPTASGTGMPTALTQRAQSSQSGAEASGYVGREANSKTTLGSSAVYAFSASAPAGMPTAMGTVEPTALTQGTQSSQSGANRRLVPSGIPWLPEVPEGWEVMRNKTLLKLTDEKVGDRRNDFTLLSLTKQGVIVRDLTEMKGKFPKDYDTYLVVRPGNLVFCLFDVDETPRTVGLVRNVGMLTGAYTNFRVEREVVLPEFAYYFYLYVDNEKKLRPYYTGLRKVVKVNTFLQLRMPVPPLAEQREIVAYIEARAGKIDAAVEKLEAEVAALKEFKQRLIADVVTGQRKVA